MNPDELKGFTFLNAVLDQFQKRMLTYYFEGASPEEKRDRANQIKDAVKHIPALLLGIAAPKLDDPIDNYGCPPGTHCENGVCVDNRSPSNFPSAGSTDATELRTFAFHRAVLDAFRQKVTDYFHSGATPQEKLARATQIKDAIKNIPTPQLGLAAPNPHDPHGNHGCPPGTRCECGVCVDDRTPVNCDF